MLILWCVCVLHRCVEMLINEQMRRYIERMEEIEQLEYAETLAKNQLKLKRSNTVRAEDTYIHTQAGTQPLYFFYYSVPPPDDLQDCLSVSSVSLSAAGLYFFFLCPCLSRLSLA